LNNTKTILTSSGPKPVEILLVEDSSGDVRLTREALKSAKILNHLTVVSDGVEAMKFLRHQGEYTGSIEPRLILLDLNLPRKNGREVLEEIKSDVKLRHIPVVILTTSSEESDVFASYQHHANCFITKPVDFPQFLKVIASIEDFWLTVVSLPERNENSK
jgi:chemotaxis family two-component system response regulator Rcp1